MYLLFKKKTVLYKKYINEFGTLSPDEYDDLISRKWLIEKTTKGVKGQVIGNAFKEVFIDKETAADEFWTRYPITLNVNGVLLPAKGMAKDKFVQIYYNLFNGLLPEHEKIIKDLEYGVANDLIRVKIETYLSAHMHMQHRQLRENGTHSTDTQSQGLYDNDL